MKQNHVIKLNETISLRRPLVSEDISTSLDCTDTSDRKITYAKYKVIHSGNVIEVYEHEIPVRLGFDTSQYRVKKVNSEEDRSEEYDKQRGTRARNNARRLALSNFNSQDKFVTFTFEDNVTDIVEANYEFRKFIKRLNRKFGNVNYLTAIQFQERGAVHYHTLMRIPYIPKSELQAIWGHGIIDIRKLNSVDNVGAYITRYMLRDALDPRLKGKKCYFTSQRLRKPLTEYINDDGYSLLINSLNLDNKYPTYRNQYESERNGKIIYREFNLARKNSYYHSSHDNS